MSDENSPRRDLTAAITADGSYLDWPAIIAGGIFALAISFLLLSFGASLGLSLSSPYSNEGVSASWLAIAAGIWFAWVMVTSFGAGGYLAGRMRRRAGDATADEVETRDGAHGLMVWATGALVSMILAASGVGGLVSAGASAVGSAAGTATDVASGAISSDYFANVMLRTTVAEPATSANTNDATTSDVPTTVDPQTAETAGDTERATDGIAPATEPNRQPAQTNTPSPNIDPAVQQQIASIITRSVANGEIAERDRSYLVQLVAANSDMDAEAARNRVDEVTAEIEDARTAAIDAVEKARVAGVVFGFIAAATLLIGAIAAFFAATAGGHHRDEGLGLAVLTTRR